jgi:hypothetical protein
VAVIAAAQGVEPGSQPYNETIAFPNPQTSQKAAA